ncbi:MAG: hypothetical protein ACD_21C00019G0002 [uncultured bacterium]|nr:MAG: hypothetical protein ACD_21C00019G0002 [uncultured bacterium]
MKFSSIKQQVALATSLLSNVGMLKKYIFCFVAMCVVFFNTNANADFSELPEDTQAIAYELNINERTTKLDFFVLSRERRATITDQNVIDLLQELPNLEILSVYGLNITGKAIGPSTVRLARFARLRMLLVGSEQVKNEILSFLSRDDTLQVEFDLARFMKEIYAVNRDMQRQAEENRQP